VLRAIRDLTGSFKAPDGSCERVRRLFTLLQEFDSDLSEHIRLENDVLFPRAVEAERSAAKRR